MTPVRQKRIRTLLRTRPNGMTPIEIAELLQHLPWPPTTADAAAPLPRTVADAVHARLAEFTDVTIGLFAAGTSTLVFAT